MKEILTFLLSHCEFLIVNGSYRFVDSELGEGFGDAYLTLQSPVLRLRFVRDRLVLRLDLQSIREGPRSYNWYGIDVVQTLVTGETQDVADLSSRTDFLERHLRDIEERFGLGRLTETARELDALERARSKRLLGES